MIIIGVRTWRHWLQTLPIIERVLLHRSFIPSGLSTKLFIPEIEYGPGEYLRYFYRYLFCLVLGTVGKINQNPLFCYFIQYTIKHSTTHNFFFHLILLFILYSSQTTKIKIHSTDLFSNYSSHHKLIYWIFS